MNESFGYVMQPTLNRDHVFDPIVGSCAVPETH